MNLDKACIKPLYLLKPTKNTYEPLKAQGVYSGFYGISNVLISFTNARTCTRDIDDHHT